MTQIDTSKGLAVITGAGDGIGRAAALELTQHGYQIAVLDIRNDAVHETVTLIEKNDGKAIGYECDISDPDNVATCAEAISKHGPVTLFWANAGLGTAGGVLSAKRSGLEWMYAVNLWGTIDTCRAFIPAMIESGQPGQVVFTASSACLGQIERNGAYAASKYAFWGLAEALRGELLETSLSVSIVYPGLVNTQIWNGARARPERFGGPRHAPEDAGTYWQQGLDVNEVAKAAVDGVLANNPYIVVPYKDTNERFEKHRDALLSGFPAT